MQTQPIKHHLASFKKSMSKITPLLLLYSALSSIHYKGKIEQVSDFAHSQSNIKLGFYLHFIEK